jgi:hypothetical protein
MADEDRPLSQLVQQGWEIVGYSSAYDHSNTMISDSVLLRRQRAHKILRIRRKFFSRSLTFKEIDI